LSRELTQLRHERPALQQVYLACGRRRSRSGLCSSTCALTPVTCAAEPAGPRELDLQDVVHPLVQPAHALNLRWSQGALITGRNGAGKSTLLRTVGLNVVVARAFGFCYARRARVPAVTVVASLQVEDSLRTATSLYMAELDRARALLTGRTATTPVLVLIDEIFRGTNHLESVAATAAGA
jgi:DNA mismatch repair ATPase MutS